MKALHAGICAVAVLTVGTAAVAQTRPGASDHFTFTVAHGSGRLDLNVKLWANDSERNAVMMALRDGGARGLESALSRLPEAGYLNWTDGLEYIVRYAYRIPVPGGEDVVLAMDHPLTFWWDRNLGASMASVDTQNRPLIDS